MVTTLWHGRTGNNLFQYVFARLIAEHNGLCMATSWPHQAFIATTKHKAGRVVTGPLTVEMRDLYWDQHGKDFFALSLKKSRIICDGFFQDPKYYDSNEEQIRGFFKLEDVPVRPDNEIVLHLRLGDYFDKGLRSVISPQWYGKILQNMNFNYKKHKLFIVCEDKSHRYLSHFMYYKPKIISQSPAEDFHFIRGFQTILCSNSSFCWWAAFLSRAKKIYTFSPWIREPHGAKLRLAFMKRAMAVNGSWLP